MRGTLLLALLATGLVALGVSGCGGDDPLAPQAPGPPADVQIPRSSEAPGSGSGSGSDNSQDGGSSSDSGTSSSDSSGSDSGTTGDSGAATPSADATAPEATAAPDQGGGAAAPDATPDGPTNDTQPPAGSEPQQFEDFCAQNPGAC